MSAKQGEDKRQALPRWRTFRATALGTQELVSLRKAPGGAGDAHFRRLVRDFDETDDLYVAAELLSAATVSLIKDDPAIDRAAGLVLDHERSPASLLTAVRARGQDRRATWKAEGVPTDPEGEAKKDVARLRSILRREPRNSIRRVDLALAHAILGDDERAIAQMTAALGLAPDSRFVLRSATRLFVHVQEHDRALRELRRSPRLTHDPWLLAAEMSTAQAAGRKIQTVRTAREVLTNQSFSPHSLSELGSELATQEMLSGRDKVARRLLTDAMREPNENAVAQAQWVAKKVKLDFDDAFLGVDRAFEARARVNATRGEWEDAVQNGLNWLRDQPFARDAAVSTSYWAATGLADFRTTADVAESGLRVHPEDPLLNNNAAFALANLGDLNKARRYFARIPKDSTGSYDATYRATEGLILYREGALEAAREAYADAIDLFRARREPGNEAVASLQRSIQELLIDPSSSFAQEAVLAVQGSIKNLDSVAVPALTKQLEDALTRVALRQFLQE